MRAAAVLLVVLSACAPTVAPEPNPPDPECEAPNLCRNPADVLADANASDVIVSRISPDDTSDECGNFDCYETIADVFTTSLTTLPTNAEELEAAFDVLTPTWTTGDAPYVVVDTSGLSGPTLVCGSDGNRRGISCIAFAAPLDAPVLLRMVRGIDITGEVHLDDDVDAPVQFHRGES